MIIKIKMLQVVCEIIGVISFIFVPKWEPDDLCSSARFSAICGSQLCKSWMKVYIFLLGGEGQISILVKTDLVWERKMSFRR